MTKKRSTKKKRNTGQKPSNGTVLAQAPEGKRGTKAPAVKQPKPPRVSKRQQRLEAQAKAARMKRLRAFGLVVLVLAVITGAVAWRNAGVVPVEELLDSTPANLLGPETAPVRIVEYGDFGCPSCRAWHNAGIREQLLADFGDQLSFEFRHFPVITAQSPKAAEAAQCASEQGAFWE